MWNCLDMADRPETQGHEKMLRYIQDLVRNEIFMKEFRKLIKLRNKYWGQSSGTYYDWTPEEQARHDQMNKELGYLSKEYERLRKRAEKILEDKHFQQEANVAETYGIDVDLIGYIEAYYAGKLRQEVERVQGKADGHIKPNEGPFRRGLSVLSYGKCHIQPCYAICRSFQ